MLPVSRSFAKLLCKGISPTFSILFVSGIKIGSNQTAQIGVIFQRQRVGTASHF